MFWLFSYFCWRFLQSKKEDLAEMKEKRTRREEGTRKRKEELGRFRQMLCAVSNV